MTLYPTLAVLYFTTIFFGGFQIWVYSLAELFILSLSLFFLFFTIIKSYQKKQPLTLHYSDPVTLAALVFLAYIAFQLVPLPPALLKLLSPMSWEIWNRSPLPPGSYYPISIHPFATKHSLIFTFCLFLIYLWIIYGIRTRRQLETLVVGVIVLGMAEVLYGMFENLSGRNHILWVDRMGRNDDVTGTFINHDHFASFLSLTICLGLGFFWSLFFLKKDNGKRIKFNKIILFIEQFFDRQGVKGILVLLSLLIMTVGLLMTTSRGGTISLLVAMVFIFGVIISLRFKAAKTQTFIILASLMLSFAAYMTLERVWDKFRDIESSLKVRWEMTEGTWALHKDFPAFGSGLGSFENLFPKYQTDLSYYVDHAHNDWVEILAETGWIGFGIIAFCLTYLFIRAIPNIKKQQDPLYLGLSIGGLGAILSISLHSLGEFSLHKPSIAWLVAIVLGITQLTNMNYSKITDTVQLKTLIPLIKDKPPFYSLSLERFFPIIIVFISLPVAYYIGINAIRNLLMSRFVRIESTIGSDPKTPEPLRVIRAIQIDPSNSLGWYWLAISLSENKNKLISINDGEINRHIISTNTSNEMEGIYRIPRYYREALSRQPGSQLFWRELSSKSLELLKLDPEYFDLQIRNYFENMCFFKPYDPSAWFEKGVFFLSKENRPPNKGKGTWRNDFRTCLNLNPKYASSVVDELFNYQKMDGLNLLPQILPQKAKAWIMAGQTLLDKGLPGLGETIYSNGEKLKNREAAKLIEKINKLNGKNKERQIRNLSEELNLLDPDNPWGWYFRGEILKCLNSALKRGIRLKSIEDLDSLEKHLFELKERNPGNLLTVNFYLALINIEQEKYVEAKTLLEQVLAINPNFFPALVAQEQILKITGTSESDQIKEKIDLFSMEEIQTGAWIDGKPGQNDQKIYRAIFRNRRAIQELALQLPASDWSWAIFIENRFVGSKFVPKKSLKISLPDVLFPGEYQIQLIQLTK